MAAQLVRRSSSACAFSSTVRRDGLAAGPGSPYLRSVSWLPRPSSPTAVLRDFVAFVRQREREHVLGAIMAFLVTLIIVIIFLIDPKVNTAPPEQVTYAEIYPANRTDADIIRDQKKDAAERLAAKKEKQRQFKELENQLGM